MIRSSQVSFLACASAMVLLTVAACREAPPADRVRASGQIEATDVRVSAQVSGRLKERPVVEGQRVQAGDLIAQLDTADSELQLTRARADRAQADAQLRLVKAGARAEDIRQAEAQAASADAESRAAASDLANAETDATRFEALLKSNSGSVKQRDDAVARRDMARQRLQAAQERTRAANETVQRLRAGARQEEIDAAAARVSAADAQIAVWEKAIADARIVAPIAGTVTETIAEVGEQVQPRAPMVVISDVDHAWANVYVDEPLVPRLRVGQAATLFTDAGGTGTPGTVSVISDKAEFTPRNVQTAEDRSKLVYRVKVTVDNSSGLFKAGMPVEAEMLFEH
ncbi:MAG: HlyD family efflux transporter periplasmic adaptor subunit [Acidobacteriaceae bacterium]|nr:HlyD family efflux transporter periplasmic adaptor subunit [Acidobacteriaceae bacterium]